MSSSRGGSRAAEAPPPARDIFQARGNRSQGGAGFWIAAWWPVAIGIGIIVLESTVWGGSDHTSGPLHALYQFLFGPVPDADWEEIHHYIRKTGHFLGYGTLCLTWLRAWRMSFPGFRYLKDATLAVLGTACIASGDELHQHFLPNRGSSPWDVLLDCSGAVVMTILAWVALRYLRPRRQSSDT